MKQLGFIGALLALSIPVLSSHLYVSGDVSGTWAVDTVFATKDIKVPSGQTLHIEPGTLVLFQGFYFFEVAGSVFAGGTENDPIKFSASDTIGFFDLWEAAGGWRGLWFDHLSPANDSSRFVNCRFEYGKASYDPDSACWYGGVACVRQSDRIVFRDCVFEHNRAFKNGGALYIRNSDILIRDCEFYDNFCGLDTLYGYGGGICLEYSESVVKGCYFEGNSSTGVGGGLSFEYSDPLVINNIFHDNYSALGGGFVCLRSDGNRTVANNLVTGNEALFFGGGIAVLETTMLFANNTVADNYGGAGGGIYFNANSFSVFKNCILWGNYDLGGGGAQVYIWDTFSAPEFYYCDVEDGVLAFGGTGGQPGGFIGIYEDNIELDPEFAGAGSHPYTISGNSSCSDAGTPDTTGLLLPALDLAGKMRFSGPFVDIGAYEYQQPVGIKASSENELQVSLFPNPVVTEFTVVVENYCPGPVFLTLADLSGRIVFQTSQDANGERIIFSWNGKDSNNNKVLPGIYLCMVRSGSFIRSYSVVISE